MQMDESMDQQLFVEESKFAFQTGPSSSGFPTSVYRHSGSSMRVVLCRMPQPLFSLNIYVPTFSPNDKGLPHTLEHLVFCGSKRYPQCGYIDALANCNLAQGTNAWTYEDATCYTLSAASEDAIANVLPVYLDHVLNPLLKEDHFINEVYHFDEAGKEQGVVFSEMLTPETEEDTLADAHLTRLMFPRQSIYGHSFGGRTHAIATLTNQEIIDYHRKFYDVNNITIVMTGPFSEQFEDRVLQRIPPEIIQSRGRDSRTPADCSPPPNEQPHSEHIQFPSADTDVGSFRFGWRGPQLEDVEKLTALEILLEYLGEDTSSPLSQRFVERVSPLASCVSVFVKESVPTTLFVSFDGVPYADGADGAAAASDSEEEEEEDSGSEADSEVDEVDEIDEGNDEGSNDPDIPRLFEEGYLQSLLHQELQRVYDTSFDGDELALQKAAQQYSQKLAQAIEDKPDEVVQGYLNLDIVASHFSPGHGGKFSVNMRASIFDVIADLGRRPAQYWLDLLKTWFLDAPVYHVAMIPDATMGARLEDERKAIEKANAASIKDVAAHTKRIKQAVEARQPNLSAELKSGIPRADPGKAGFMLHTFSRTASPKPLGPFASVQVVEASTEFPDLRLHLRTGALPDKARPYLLLFRELMQSSDLLLPAGVRYDTETHPLSADRSVDYVTVSKRLADLTSSKDTTIGISTESFVHYSLDELLVISMRAPEQAFETATRWVLQALFFAEFTADRILTAAQNMLGELTRVKRDGWTVMQVITTRLWSVDRPGEPGWIENHLSLFEQESVLKQIVSDAKRGDCVDTAAELNAIKQALLFSTGGFISLGVSADKDKQKYIDQLSCEWRSCADGYSRQLAKKGLTVPLPAELAAFPILGAPRVPALKEPFKIQVPLKSVQVSSAAVCLQHDLDPFPNPGTDFGAQLAELPALDYYALTLLTELLHRTDGPLFTATRGKGYAYGSYFVLAHRHNMLKFCCLSASDAPRAILAMQRLIEDLDANWNTYVGDFEIKMTLSTMAYDHAAAQATLDAVVESTAVCSIFGFETLEHRNRWRSAHLAAVTQQDMRRVYEKYLRRFIDPSHPSLTIMVTPLDTEMLPELGIFERRTLDEFQ
ncbi:hypothetical protein GGF46_001986 [Coemansia sp. RSA 552]|nr:hypothetical protein GGF46_001986 [Coemansia sp. RSA 552]